jgi:ethanolamine utilization protein EutQ (cupin superfamily)
LIYTNTAASGYIGGVLAPNGDIHFIPFNAPVGQKVSYSGTVNTYTLAYTTTTSHQGGVLAPNGDIHFVPTNANIGQKISTMSAVPFPSAVCLSPYFNKL